MLTLILPITQSLHLRDQLLEDIARQSLPKNALQVVLVSHKKSLLQGLEDSPLNTRSVFVEKLNRDLMKNLGVRHASGDFFYILNEETIFDNQDDLLKLYEFFLENPEVDAIFGYSLLHRVLEPKNLPMQIISSEVLPADGEFNICLRRKCVESGFLFGHSVFSSEVLKELEAMGMHVRTLKWLQLHHQKTLWKPQAAFYIAKMKLKQWIWTLKKHPRVFDFAEKVQGLQLAERTRHAFYRVKALYKFLQPKLIAAMKSFVERLLIFAAAVRQILRKQSLKLQQRFAKKEKPPLPGKVFVPHLTSSDAAADSVSQVQPQAPPPEKPTKPMFSLKKKEDNPQTEFDI